MSLLGSNGNGSGNGSSEHPPDAHLVKQVRKLLHRIERIMVPSNALVASNVGELLDGVMAKVQKGLYFREADAEIKQMSSAGKKLMNKSAHTLESAFCDYFVDWDALEYDIALALSTISGDGSTVSTLNPLVIEEIATERRIQADIIEKLRSKERLRCLQERNQLPVIVGRWRKEPYNPRKYDPLKSYALASGLGAEEGTEVYGQLDTTLNGFLGQAYNYDDHGLTEEWMLTFRDGNFTASDDDVIRTQLESLLEILTVQVQDRVCTERGVLLERNVVLGRDIKEVPVWGIDCYTRRMLELIIEDSVSAEMRSDKAITAFIERRILPAINAQSPDKAHNMNYAMNHLIAQRDLTDAERIYVAAVQKALNNHGIDLLKIHPKGTGVICTNPSGIAPHVVVSDYLGEMYPPYRWCEKLDVVEQAQAQYGLKPTLPDFYNILLERPRQDPKGYGLLYVDASQRANVGSSCSHSCNSNCTSSVVARNGKLVIVLTTNRYIYPGEELTMDYYSITTSDVEWRAAICLCGSSACRGSFLHYATQDDLQQVLNQNCGPLWRYASLLRACSSRPVSEKDSSVLDRHGMREVAFGKSPIPWMQKYVADNLRFVEFERMALPCALLRGKDGKPSLYTYSAADMDARSVMEQRIQSMICCSSMVRRVFADNAENAALPLVTISGVEAAARVWEMLRQIPTLMEDHLLHANENNGGTGNSGKQVGNTKSKKKSKPAASIPHDPPPQVLAAPIDVCEGSPEVPAAVSTSRSTAAEKNNSDPSQRYLDLVKAVDDIKEIVAEDPKGLSGIRKMCLDIRKVLLKVQNYGHTKARLGLLADLLILWGFTTNFSCAKDFATVKSNPITVVARELGTNIPRMQIFKPEPFSKRKSLSQPLYPEMEIFNGSARSSGGIATDSSLENTANSANIEESNGKNVENIAIAESAMVIDSSAVGAAEGKVETGESASSAVSSSSNDADEESSSSSSSSSSFVQHHSTKEKKPSAKDLMYLSPEEPIHIGVKVYEPMFVFWQLMGWFNAGTDQKVGPPDLFGCVQLPPPFCCFGPAELPYGPKQREVLLKLIQDEKAQTMAWPTALKGCFTNFATAPRGGTVLYGSPMLDIALGRVDAVTQALEEFRGKNPNSLKAADAVDNSQLDNILPPEIPTAWVQCDLCRQWRRVAWHVDSEALPDSWQCSMNYWEPESATCDAPQDNYNPDKESTLCFNVEKAEFQTGQKWDVFCLVNRVYYEATVLNIKEATAKAPKMVKFHFKGWSAKFDEWVEADSERIQAHNLFTKPDAARLSDQEKWQGVDFTVVDANGKPLPQATAPSGKGKKRGAAAALNSKTPGKANSKSKSKGKGASKKRKSVSARESLTKVASSQVKGGDPDEDYVDEEDVHSDSGENDEIEDFEPTSENLPHENEADNMAMTMTSQPTMETD